MYSKQIDVAVMKWILLGWRNNGESLFETNTGPSGFVNHRTSCKQTAITLVMILNLKIVSVIKDCFICKTDEHNSWNENNNKVGNIVNVGRLGYTTNVSRISAWSR